MGLSRQAIVSGALREQKLMRRREEFLAAALDVVNHQKEIQHIAEVFRRREAAAAAATLRRRVCEVRSQLSSGLEERRCKLKALLEGEQNEAKAMIRQLQQSAATREHAMMQRAEALRRKRDQERNEEDKRLDNLRHRQGQDDLRLQEHRKLVKEVSYPSISSTLRFI